MDYRIIPYAALPSAYTPRNPGRRIDMIVLHATAGSKTGDLWTLSGRDRLHLVSTHYYITKIGEIYQLVEDKDIAWHAGESYWQGEEDCNRFSLGVELENRNDGRDAYPEAQLAALLWLVRIKVQQYKIPRSRLVRHAEIAVPHARKTDPRGFPWSSWLEQVYADIPPGPPSPPAAPLAPERILRTALIQAAYQRVRHMYNPNWSLHQVALNERLGPPLVPMFGFKAENRDWVGEIYGVDAICSPVDAWSDVRRLSQLPDGAVKAAFRAEVFQELGALYHPESAMQQYAERKAIGVPLSESFRVALPGGDMYSVQIFSLDTLITPDEKPDTMIPLSNLLSAKNLSSRDLELRDLLLSRQFQRAGSKYRADWTMHQAAIRLGLGAPLGDQQHIEMGVQDYVAQAFARDVLYSPIGDWGVVKQLSALL